MKIKEVIANLEMWASPKFQEDYDNSQLIAGDREAQVSGVLVALDAIEAVVDEAINLGCNLIVAHHPIVFTGLKSITGASYIERTLIKAIKNDIAIYAIHTNLDNIQTGVNAKICEKLGLVDTRILKPKYGEAMPVGAGMTGYLSNPMDEMEFLTYVKDVMKTNCIRHTPLLGSPIEKVAVCGGSGSFLLADAIEAGAQVFITADYKYHQFFDAENKILIADIGHYESEQYTIDLLFAHISKNFTNFASHCTKVNTNPVNYF